MSSSESDSEFLGFDAVNLGSTSRTTVDNDNQSDISVSSVDTSDLSDFSDVEQPVDTPPNWKREKTPITVCDFEETVGPTSTLTADKNELDFLDLLFPPMLYALLATETNRYAKQCQEKARKPDKQWADNETTATEIRCFLGIHIYMSIVQLPSYKSYWSSDHLFGNFPIKHFMTRSRFEKILQYFHTTDSTQNPRRGLPGHDKLHHIRHIMGIVQGQAFEQYHPHRENAIDEAMVAFRGRLGFRQYIPAKPHKYGIKVWVRADSHNGYVCDFNVYTGKEGNRVEVGLGESVVLKLCERIAGKYYHIYCDNYFSSVRLFKKLLEKRVYACGTIRTNRKCWPKDLNKKAFAKKAKGYIQLRQDGNLVASGWKDNKAVFLLSTTADPTVDTTIARKQRDGSIVDIPCPSALPQYNQYMNGVDMADQNRTQYSSCRKSIKWWKYLFWFLFDTCISNSLILLNSSPNHKQQTSRGNDKKTTNLYFRMALAKLLIGKSQSGRKRQAPQEAATVADDVDHWPEKRKSGTCKECSKRGKRCERRTGCGVCGVNLCIDDCFKKYHLALRAGN